MSTQYAMQICNIPPLCPVIASVRRNIRVIYHENHWYDLTHEKRINKKWFSEHCSTCGEVLYFDACEYCNIC
jgi:hypothetical protein